jgi:uncharacterized phiE125 gp8 family phage protein
MPEKIITAPSTEPITLDEAKAQLRWTNNAEDALISFYISVARDLCEMETGRALTVQTWEQSRCGFADEMMLGRAPVASIASIKYTDSNGVEQTLASTEYVLDNSSDSIARVVLAPNKSWPAVYAGINTVRIRYVAGYASADAVPPVLRQWMLLQITHWFKNRQSVEVGNVVNEFPFVKNLLNAYRIYSL